MSHNPQGNPNVITPSGDSIGVSGNTGSGHKYHLHFGIAVNDKFCHPLGFLPYTASNNITVNAITTEPNKLTLKFLSTGPFIDLDKVTFTINLNNNSHINVTLPFSPYNKSILNPINAYPSTNLIHTIVGTDWKYALKGEKIGNNHVLTVWLTTDSEDTEKHATSVTGQAINTLNVVEKSFDFSCFDVTDNVLLLGDATGSMYETQQDIRKISFLKAFHTSLNSNKMIQSLYTFYCDGEDLAHPNFVNIIPEGQYSYNPATLPGAYMSINASASSSCNRATLFNTAISSARNALFSANQDMDKHIILVSDGRKEDYESEALIRNAALSLPNNVKLHTIGLLTGLNQQLMKRIATWGKGKYYYLGPLDSPYEIATALQSEILSTSVNSVQNGVIPYTGDITSYQEVINKIIYVDNPGYPIKCSFSYYKRHESSANYETVVLPAGFETISKKVKIYTPSNYLLKEADTALLAQYGIVIVNNNNSASVTDLLVEINNPTQGNWRVVIETANTNNNTTAFNIFKTVHYTFSSMIDSKIFVDLDNTTIENAKKNEAIMIKAKIINLEDIPLSHVSFLAEVGIPGTVSWLSEKVIVQMFQDPIDPTIYKGFLNNTNKSGSYSFKIFFNAECNGCIIERVNYCTTFFDSPSDYDSKTYHNGWNWVSYPRLYAEDENNIAQDYESLFYPISKNLNQVLGIDGKINKDNDLLYTEDLPLIFSNQGYKLEFTGLPNNTLTYDHYGTQINPDEFIYLNQDQYEYWLGYNRLNNQDPLGSFSSAVRPYITSIKGEDWFMFNVNGNWATTAHAVFEYGKGYEVTFSKNRNFNSFQIIETQAKEKIIIPVPQYFSFKELSDYQCVLVDSITDVTDLREIAVYQDTTCVGAAVFEGYPIHIKAYVKTETKSSEPITFRLVTNSKQTLNIKNALVYDMSTNTYKPGIIEANPKKLAKVLLNAKDCDVSQIVVPLSLSQNYPNPFNPNTKICFSIPSDDNIKINIYNVKGQRVKQLIDKSLKKGYHSINWDSTDQNNKAVTSGVYFYQLKTSKNVLIKKMLLIK